MVNEALDKPSAVLLGKRAARPETIYLEALVPPLDFTVALRVIGGSLDMGQPSQADEFLTVLSLPLVKQRWVDVVLVAQIENAFAFNQMLPENGDLLLGSEITSVVVVHRGLFFQPRLA